jgi:hypothetical protein
VNGKFLPLTADGIRLPLLGGFGDEEPSGALARGFLCGVPLQLFGAFVGLGRR